MKKNAVYLTLIILLSATVRLYFAYGVPASGDETLGLTQSCGKAHLYGQFWQEHIGTVIPAEDISWFIEYSDDQGLSSVAESMKRAGMHPPLYYFFLHYVMKYLGNDPLPLRCISILFSLGSIVMVYRIGKELKGSRLGLMAAALFGISTYGVKFAFMIRPYPMVMFIALLSAWVALRWSRKERFRFRDRHYWAIVTLSIAGFYSIYHFVFMLAFLWSFLFFKSLSRKRDIPVILSIPIITALAFLPWLSSLQTQMQVVNQGDFYFNSLANPIAGVGQLLTLNFTKFLPVNIISLLLLAVLPVLGIAGLLLILKQQNGRLLVASLIIYVIANTLLDLILKTNTICILKLAFFLNPVSLLFLAAGCEYFKDRFQWRYSPWPMLFVLAIVNCFFAIPESFAYDGPYPVATLKELNREMAKDENCLAIMSPGRREVLPFIHAMDTPPAVLFMDSIDYCETLSSTETLRQFDSIMLFAPTAHPDAETNDATRQEQQSLEASGYRLDAEYSFSQGHVCIFKKNAAAPLKQKAQNEIPAQP